MIDNQMCTVCLHIPQAQIQANLCKHKQYQLLSASLNKPQTSSIQLWLATHSAHLSWVSQTGLRLNQD